MHQSDSATLRNDQATLETYLGVAKIEAASNEVSLDLMLRGFFSAGGRLTDIIPIRVVPEPEAVRP